MKFLFACLVFLSVATVISAQGGVTWYNCGVYNPCGRSRTLFYYSFSLPQYFVQCGLTANQCYYVLCRPGTVWNQAALTCVYDPSVPYPSQILPVWPQTPYIPGTFNCGNKNPCTTSNAAQNRFYFSHEVRGKYVQCDNFQKCFTRDCPNGEVWDAWGYTCVKP